MESMQRSNVYFVHCLLPHHTAAVHKSSSSTDNCSLNMQLLRSQLRGLQLLDALLVQKQGFCSSLC